MLSDEADETSMKASETPTITDDGPEPSVIPGPSDDIDALSKAVGNRLQEVLTGSASKQTKQKKIADLVSSAVKKGHEIGAIQNAVQEAMADLSQQEGRVIKPEALEFAEKTVNQIVETSKDIAQGDPNDPYIKSLNAEADETLVIEKQQRSEKQHSVTSVYKAAGNMNKQSKPIVKTEAASRTIVVLKGESLSSIAAKIYGSVNKYPLLYEANRNVLKNPDLIIVGQVLTIPPLP